MKIKNTHLPAGWEVKTLGEVCEYDKNQNTHSGLPYVGLEHIESHSGRFIGSLEPQKVKSSTFHFNENHVLYGRLRPYLNKVLLPDFEGHCSTEIFPIKAKAQLLREFLFYWLITDSTVKRINATWTGARMPRANMNQVLEFDFFFPPLAEQRRIVGILDEAFSAIETAKAHAERNRHNAKELFESYLHSIFATQGDGWEEKKLGEVCDFVRGPFGGSLKKNIFKPDGYAVYEQQHAIYDQFDDVRYFIDEVKFLEMKRFELNPEDLIMSCSGTMGRVAIVPSGIKRGIINQALLKISTGKRLLNTYLKSWMESESFQNSLKKYSGGAAIQNVASVSTLKSIEIPLPSLKEQQRIVRQLDALRAETQRLEQVYANKVAALDELKKSLLHKAFAGEL